MHLFGRKTRTLYQIKLLLYVETMRLHGENMIKGRLSLPTLLTNSGLGDDSKVGLYLHNSNEYLESQYSVFKIKGVPINVNYRYKEEELIYLLENSDSEADFLSKLLCRTNCIDKGQAPQSKTLYSS